MNEKELVVVDPRDCPNCRSPAGATNCDYDCPCCGAQFCSKCYGTDLTGPGTYVFCPVCKQKLNFPVTLLRNLEDNSEERRMSDEIV